ncbi:hypothetical protein ACH5RR_034620 [Cinchona calisaya]|uniref:VQ domain-containing protein n=1 Tax=Cinchona calisaya TaxID=153742 RepID=A0ABD2YBF5_9GENT
MEKHNHSSHAAGGGEFAVTTTTTATSSGTTSSSISATYSSSDNYDNNNNNNRDMYLKHLNKISHKISKPIRRPTTFDQNQPQNPTENQPSQGQGPSQSQQQPQQQNQPPVYNINKNDFRDVVQRLTGSPAHDRFSTPPPIQPPKPPSTRLQRIRPPPLAQISNCPPPPQPPPANMLNCAGGGATNAGFLGGGQRQPLSPLPPFPAVHAAAESPISAYMRFIQSSVTSAASPRWNNLPPPQMPPLQQQNIPPVPQASMAMPQFPLLPTSPLPFGCVPSPKSPYALLSPSLLFSPTGQLGFQQLPLSPSLPVPSPRWKGI